MSVISDFLKSGFVVFPCWLIAPSCCKTTVAPETELPLESCTIIIPTVSFAFPQEVNVAEITIEKVPNINVLKI